MINVILKNYRMVIVKLNFNVEIFKIQFVKLVFEFLRKRDLNCYKIDFLYTTIAYSTNYFIINGTILSLYIFNGNTKLNIFNSLEYYEKILN